MAAEAVNWADYFQYIRTECPWSLQAFKRGGIDIVKGTRIQPLGEYEARVYIVKNINPRRLKKLCNQLDKQDKQNEWLWSHPRYRKFSTPVPTLIQQNRARLTEIRSKLQGLIK